MQAINNPFRNARLPQTGEDGTHNYGEKRGGSTRGRRGNFHSDNRFSFRGGGQLRGGRGRGGYDFGRGGSGLKRGGMERELFGLGGTMAELEITSSTMGGTDDLTCKEKNWGKIKFNPVAAEAKEENSTPWKKFKDDMAQKKDFNTAKSVESQEVKDFKENQAKNHRKAQILQNQQKPTEWDDFGATDTKTDPQKEQCFQTYKLESAKRRGDELLQNFKSNNLSTAQKNHLRKVITKTTIIVKGNSMEHVVKDMKRQKELKALKQKSK